ncbi:sensor histidine kinase [Paenibacillus sp. 1P07SE]|uniref:sensor histidine kinase n=1 Tax=Paenibacillus sp. 1P07SE TaxID=3132209 RepID=UPI0039A4CE1F
MSITGRLKLAFLAMLVAPQLLLVGVLLLAWPIIGDNIDLFNAYEVNREREQELIGLTGEVNYVLREDAEKLSNPAYAGELIDRYGQWESAIRIEREGQLIAETSWIEGIDAGQVIQGEAETVKYGGKHYFVTQLTPPSASSDRGLSVTLFLNYDPLPFYFRPLIMLLFLISIAITMFVLAYLVSQSLTRPLEKLRRAAEQIEAGNLDYRLDAMKNNEIGQVRNAFESMRLRLKQSIEERDQIDTNRKGLIAGISHDLKTPITAIKGYVEGILDGVANTDEMRTKYIRTVYKKATEMDGLIDELFLFSKLDLNEEPYEMRTVNLLRYLEDYLEECRFDIEKTGADLDVVIQAGRELPVLADREKLSRVLSNVINNSLKYMARMPASAEKRISVILTEGAGEAQIEIRDTGPGIEREALPHIFDHFYRAEQSRNSALGGSGLGLAIVKQIVLGHGGRVYAESEHGQGSSIVLTLPLAQQMEG